MPSILRKKTTRIGVTKKATDISKVTLGFFLLILFSYWFYYDYKTLGIVSFFLPLALILNRKVGMANILRVGVLFVAIVCCAYLITEIVEILELATGILGLAIIYVLKVNPIMGFIMGFALGVLTAVPVGRRKERRTE